MSEGFGVEVEQLRGHASNVEGVRARFDAVQAASSHIAQDDQAYGLLCGWISAVLEGRHTRQDELVAYVAENLTLAGEALQASADHYEAVDGDNANLIGSVGSGLPS